MLEATILGTDSEFDSLQREWDELLESSDQRVFFLRWHWVRSWWRYYAPRDSRLLLVVCRCGGRLVGLAPFYMRRQRQYGVLALREVCFLGTGRQRVSEHLDIIARRGSEEEVGRTVATVLHQSVSWDRFWLWGTPASSTVFPHFRSALGAGVSTAVCDRAYVIDTSQDWEQTKRVFRHDVDRMFKQLWRDGQSHDVRVQSLHELGPALDDLIRLHQRRWVAKGNPGAFAHPGFEQLIRHAAADSLVRGRLGLWQLYVNGRCRAALIAFVDFGTAHYFQSGFDPGAPGVGRILVGLAIRDCVNASGIRRFDMMGGGSDSGYKTDWTPRAVDIIELECLGRGLRPAIFRFLRRSESRVVRLLTRLPAPAKRLVRAGWKRVAQRTE